MTAKDDTSFTPTPGTPNRETPPDSSTAIQAGLPPSGETSIPLPPIAAPVDEPITPEELAAEIRRLDWVLCGVVLVLAFLLASFAVRNSDFFNHLAQGRLYAHGQFHFGTDQFTYTKTNYWANPSWLYDLALYGIATVAGGVDSPVAGVILVVLKALLVALLAWIMLKTSRPGRSKWAPALCAALALVAMSPRLLFQPTLISMLFLAVTLYILQSPRHTGSARRDASREKSPLPNYWLLPILFALWANLDAWWILGPATVALYLLGQTLQQILTPIRTGDDAPEPGLLGILSLVLIAGLAAGVLNPHHIHAYTLPALISPTAATDLFEQDRTLRTFFQSALRDDYFSGGVAMNAAALAYFPLLAIGLLSFALSLFGEWRWWRFLVWLAFAVLSAYRVRTMPFFAVVAGPIAALNFQDFAASNFGIVPRVDRAWRAFSLGGRVVSLLVGVAAILAAWPGWLHGRPSDPTQARRVSWQIAIDPSMRAAAEKLNDWHARDLLSAEEHGFNYHPDIANYCAWYCADPATGLPREKAFFDYRLELFPREVVSQYVGIRKALIEPATDDQSAQLINWQDVFRKQKITHVTVSRGDQDFLLVWLVLLQDWKEWPLLAVVQGRTIVFRWQDPLRRPARSTALARLDLGPLGFGADAVKAPPSGPAQTAQPQDLLARFWRGPPVQSAAEDESARYMEYFNLIHRLWYKPYLATADFGMLSAAVGMAGQTPGGAVVAQGQLMLSNGPIRLSFAGSPRAMELCMTGKDFGPPAAPLLAVRAARRAILESPNSATGYFRLAAAYRGLWQEQEDIWLGMRLASAGQSPRQQMRHIQTVTALEQGLRLRPTDAQGHETLGNLYYQAGYNDLALEHLQESLKYATRNPGESVDDFKKRIETAQQTLKGLDDDVRRQKNEFELESANKPVIQKAQLALYKRKLARRAIEVLQGSAEFDPQIADLLITLHLSTGGGTLDKGLDDVRDTLREASRGVGPNYERYMVLLEAATGNYAEADKYLDETIQRLENEAHMRVLSTVRNQTLGGAGALQQNNVVMQSLQNVFLIADYKVLRGILAVEAGDTAPAARHFEEAMKLNNQQAFDFESKPIGDRYLELIKAAGGAK